MHSSRMRTARSSSRPGGLHQAPPPGPDPPLSRHPPGPDPRGPDPRRAGTPPGPGTPPGTRHPPSGQTDTCKHITLPQTSFAGGNKI